ncbi:MAG: DUF1573 domain-containing protein [Saprospiraceae bacterium]|nr:DUF1573 domain-containing protein [Saprospiraceae bacterium]
MISYKFVLISIIALFVACKPNAKLEPNSYDTLINNPASANNPEDSINIPKIYFKETNYNFGIATQGDTITHEYRFYNTGKATLLISNVSSSCGCAIPKIEKQKLGPGDSSILKVVFSTNDKVMYQEKEITIFANTFPASTKILLTGYVNQ